MPSSRSATHRAGHGSNRSAASTAKTGTSSVLEPRSWRAPVTSTISLGAGISAAAARNSSMDPNGSAVPCVNTVGTLMSGRCSVLLCPDRNAVLFSDSLADGMTDYAGTRLRAMFASDLGHWDVPDACAVLPEAWELVERGHVAVDDFKAFTHDNALALWGDEMFANTVIGTR
jgi:hypothetical protein